MRTPIHQCLYYLHETEGTESACGQCGMPLPSASQYQLQGHRQRHFAWFCVGLVLSCLGMML